MGDPSGNSYARTVAAGSAGGNDERQPLSESSFLQRAGHP